MSIENHPNFHACKFTALLLQAFIGSLRSPTSIACRDEILARAHNKILKFILDLEQEVDSIVDENTKEKIPVKASTVGNREPSQNLRTQRMVAEILARRFWDGMKEKNNITRCMPFGEYKSHSLINWMGDARGIMSLIEHPNLYQEDGSKKISKTQEILDCGCIVEKGYRCPVHGCP